jgi:hypothetical protein
MTNITQCCGFIACNTQKTKMIAGFVVLVLQASQRKKTTMTNAAFVIMVSKRATQKNKD